MRSTFALTSYLVAAAGTSAAHAQLVNFTADFSGQVNGQAVQASGAGVIDLDEAGRSAGEVVFSQRPPTFDPQSVSLLSNLCSNSFRSMQTSQSLWDLGVGNYSVQRTFQWVGLQNSFIQIQSEVTSNAGGVFSDSIINGTYGGPTDIVGIRSYLVTWIPGSASGEVFEAGTMVLERSGGEELLVQFASLYTGLENDLMQIQFGRGTFDTEFDGTTLSFGWDGEFEIPAPGALAMLAIAGLTAARRRRP